MAHRRIDHENCKSGWHVTARRIAGRASMLEKSEETNFEENTALRQEMTCPEPRPNLLPMRPPAGCGQRKLLPSVPQVSGGSSLGDYAWVYTKEARCTRAYVSQRGRRQAAQTRSHKLLAGVRTENGVDRSILGPPGFCHVWVIGWSPRRLGFTHSPVTRSVCQSSMFSTVMP